MAELIENTERIEFFRITLLLLVQITVLYNLFSPPHQVCFFLAKSNWLKDLKLYTKASEQLLAFNRKL